MPQPQQSVPSFLLSQSFYCMWYGICTWYGISLWSVEVSCPCCVFSPLALFPAYLVSGGAGKRDEALTPCKHCLPVFNTVVASNAKHSTIQTVVWKVNFVTSSQPDSAQSPSLIPYHLCCVQAPHYPTPQGILCPPHSTCFLFLNSPFTNTYMSYLNLLYIQQPGLHIINNYTLLPDI